MGLVYSSISESFSLDGKLLTPKHPKYRELIINYVVGYVATGRSLTTIIPQNPGENCPTLLSIIEWIDENPEFKTKMLKARRVRTLIQEELLVKIMSEVSQLDMDDKDIIRRQDKIILELKKAIGLIKQASNEADVQINFYRVLDGIWDNVDNKHKEKTKSLKRIEEIIRR